MSGKLFRSQVKEATDDADVVAADPLGEGDGESDGERVDEREQEGDEADEEEVEEVEMEGECASLSQLLIDKLGEQRRGDCVVVVVADVGIVCPNVVGVVSIFV